MLNIENLSFTYPHRRERVVDGLSARISQGGVYGLLGPNGAGKSTLLYLIAGLLKPDSGRVLLDGVDTSLRRPSTLRDIFIVPEELTLPALRLDEYVRINAPFYPRFSQADLERHLATFEVGDIAQYKLSSLSMGQKKKVYMCFALACNTALMLMDEPTNGLDIPGKAAFKRFIASTVSDDRILIISTHQVYDVEHLLDQLMIVDGHRILLNESVSDITARLSFMVTNDPALQSRALMATPSLGGAQIVIPNDGSHDTEINLESLFMLATTRPDVIQSMFNHSDATGK